MLSLDLTTPYRPRSQEHGVSTVSSAVAAYSAEHQLAKHVQYFSEELSILRDRLIQIVMPA